MHASSTCTITFMLNLKVIAFHAYVYIRAQFIM